ncbi:unnamed protein product [Symbiodinium sp. CCMP2592]|nr:unnamed protein product [Symbiodinium sp. CCMP2592]
MYVSQDRPDIAFTVRVLSQKLREPTVQIWSSGQRLASYLACTTGYASKVHARGDKLSILEPSDPEGLRHEVMLEVVCDADWSGNKQNRRSMSSSSFFLNSCCIYTSCKSQRCVSLSSTESEFYALVSASCDGIYLKRVLEYLLEQPIDLWMRTDNQSCRQISLKQGVSKIRHLDGRFLWVQEKTADGTLKVGSVDGRRNPSDLGTKVPATGSRLRALLCMHDFVDCAGDCIQEVGRADHDQLIESLQHDKDTARVRRLINKSLKTNGLSNSNLVLIMVSLIAGADASGTRRDVSVQTEPEARWISVWLTGLVILVSLLGVMLSLERLRADRSRDDASASRTTSAEPDMPVPMHGRWSVIAATLCGVPSLVCMMLLMQLRKVRFLLVAERHETDRLQGVINEMDYDRMMWSEYHGRESASSSSSRPKPTVTRSAAAESVPATPAVVTRPELHVYCTARRGKAYHAKRACTCLNNADEILRLGLAEKLTSGSSFTEAMSGQGDQLDKMSALLAEVAAQLEQVKLQGARREEQHQDLTERMAQLEARMDAPESSAAVLIPTQLQPQSFTVPVAQGLDLNAPATIGQCMELVQMAMQQKVAPALGAVYSSLSTSQVRTNERVGNLEQQVRALRIRTAWAEKDMLFAQIEQAKRTIVCRNFPTWQTEADRRLTVEKALAKAGLWNIDGMWDLTTTRLDTGKPGQPELSAISILTVPSLTIRKRILEEKKATADEPKDSDEAKASTEGTAEPDTADPSEAAEPKEPAKSYEYKGGGPVKLSPGVTQFERRLASPLQGLMNAYRSAFSKFTKEPLVPRWKTLALVDSKEAWLGRIVYRRGVPSQTTSTGTLTDWECEIHIPEEHSARLLESWRSIWYDQLRQQVNQTTVEQEAFDSAARLTAAEAKRLSRFLTKAIPEYNEGEDEGLDHWIARFRYEFPWPVKFVYIPKDSEERTHFTGLRSTEELIEAMAADEKEASFTVGTESGGVGDMIDSVTHVKRTHSDAASAISGISSASIPSSGLAPPVASKARASFHPFASQAELEKAVEEAKIAHINCGGVPTDYPQEAWEAWCIKRRASSSQ